MNLKVLGAILPLGCAILSTRAKTVRGVVATPLRRTRVKVDEGSNVDIFVELTKMKINVCVLSCICNHISTINMLLLMFLYLNYIFI